MGDHSHMFQMVNMNMLAVKILFSSYVIFHLSIKKKLPVLPYLLLLCHCRNGTFKCFIDIFLLFRAFVSVLLRDGLGSFSCLEGCSDS